MNKLEIIKLSKEWAAVSHHGFMDFNGREIIVLPYVFPPNINTPLLFEIIEELTQQYIKRYKQCRVFEMGVGTGATILSVAKIPGVTASASDINPMAVLNAKANALWWQVECQVYEGNMFENVPKQVFDLVFWNPPFIKEDPGGVEEVKYRTCFDPGYNSYQRFFAEVPRFLSKKGQIILASDKDSSDLEEIYQLADTAGFHTRIFTEKEIYWENLTLSFIFLQMFRKTIWDKLEKLDDVFSPLEIFRVFKGFAND